MSVGRNDPCPCGSGKKFKRCCGAGKAPLADSSAAAESVPSSRRDIPTIVNNDGHLLVQTSSFYEVLDAESVLMEIESWRPKPDLDVERDATGRLAGFEAHYQRKPRATRGPGDRVLVARLEWKRGGHLVVETNSTERDLEIRERLLGFSTSDVRLLRVVGRSALDLVSEPVREKDRRRADKEQETLARHPEVQAHLAQMMRDYSLRWCDTVVPALGNRRPRSLVRTEKGRAKVLALIEEMESRPQPGGTGGMDFELIRRELDLPSPL